MKVSGVPDKERSCISPDMSTSRSGRLPDTRPWLTWVATADRGLRLAAFAVWGVAVYIAVIGFADVAGLGAVLAQSAQDPFDYAAGKLQDSSEGFMLLVRVGMAIVIVCVAIYAWWKGGKISPAMIATMVVSGFIAIRADLVVKWFGSSNPIASVN